MSKANLHIDWCSYKAAEYACKNWHYSGCIPKSKLAKFGVWENGQFVGSIIYGVGATSDLVKRYGLSKNQGCELVRIALREHESQVSRMIAITLKMLNRSMPDIRLVVSFADPEQGHHGGVYQATGWIFSGDTQASDEYIYRGRRWQGRSFRNSHKGMENHPDVVKVKGSSKHRYLMPLDKEMSESIHHLSKPYPKRVTKANSGDQSESGGAIPTHTLQTKMA